MSRFERMVNAAGRVAYGVRAYGAVSVVMLIVSVFVLWRAPSPYAPRVNVRWSADLSDAQRTVLEHELPLANAERREGTTWTYDLTDVSPAGITRLLATPGVDDTYQIDRSRASVSSGAPRGTTRLRQRGLTGVINSSFFLWIILFCFTSALVSGAWLQSTSVE